MDAPLQLRLSKLSNLFYPVLDECMRLQLEAIEKGMKPDHGDRGARLHPARRKAELKARRISLVQELVKEVEAERGPNM
jgi:hypothetical protein